MAIPGKMILTCQKADSDLVCGALIGEYREVFREGYWDYKILALFILYEQAKGANSYWDPYF